MARSTVASVRFPPPDSPDTISVEMPSASRWSITQRSPAAQSFSPAGYGNGPCLPPPLRNSTPTTTSPVAASSSRQRPYVGAGRLEQHHAATVEVEDAGEWPVDAGRADGRRA